ncbi:hypothetical protein CCH79_00016511 [Gambusia affinis]|uniref:TRIM8/14/16/25/29/45/65 coiled-coil region domain-containing protein n=1 Tax=Gambusia affinis TaxID=33528 RepID=A0A315UXW0_GAMAF|nr:hypothetical protein CCH79_00016511 [Gambusia affinis]
MLAALVEQLKKTGFPASPADHCYAGSEDVACDFCTGRKLKAFKSCLVCLVSYCRNHLQPHLDVPGLKKQKLVEPSKNLQENICSQHDEVMKMFCRTDQKNIKTMKQQIRSQQETEVSRVKDVQEKLEQEITELKRKDAELEQLSHTEDHNQFLLNYPSLPALSESTHSSSINIRPLRHFEDVTAAVRAQRETTGRPERLMDKHLTDDVAYKNISIAGQRKKCGFGGNDTSWASDCSSSKFGHNNIWKVVFPPESEIIESMTLIHRVQTKFTAPRLAGVTDGEDGGEGIEFESVDDVAGVEKLQTHEAEADHQQQDVQHL